VHSDDELCGRLPSDLTNLDSAELRQLDHATPISVESCLASMTSVTETPHDVAVTSYDVTMTSDDVIVTSHDVVAVTLFDDKVATAVRANIRLFNCYKSVCLSVCLGRQTRSQKLV